jgi:hypothetical protein
MRTKFKIWPFVAFSPLAHLLKYVYQNDQLKMKTTKHIISETTMKKSIVILGVAILSMALVSNVMAQATATQTVSLAVNAVYKIAVTGNPGGLTITDGTAGTNALTTVSDNTTRYSITQNVAGTVKVTANLDAALSAGYTLQMNLASTKGTSAGTVDVSATSPGSAVNVVSAIGMGADATQMITYTFGANASAGTLLSTNKVVTLTLTN